MSGLFSNLATSTKLFKSNRSSDEVVRKVGAFLYDDKVTNASSHLLHSIASLTFSENTCTSVFKLIREGLDEKESSILTIEKSLILIKHLVIFGAERCVDNAWSLQRIITTYVDFNSAIRRGTLHKIVGGGVDKGQNIRVAADDLRKLLTDSGEIRKRRLDNADPNSLLPFGEDDFIEPSKIVKDKKKIEDERNKERKSVGSGGIGSVSRETVIGAAYSLDDMLAKAAENNAETNVRYSDSMSIGGEVRKTNQSLDSDYTRQKMAPDLLNLAWGEDEDEAGAGIGTSDLNVGFGEETNENENNNETNGGTNGGGGREREDDLRLQLEETQRQMMVMQQQQQQMLMQQQQHQQQQYQQHQQFNNGNQGQNNDPFQQQQQQHGNQQHHSNQQQHGNQQQIGYEQQQQQFNNGNQYQQQQNQEQYQQQQQYLQQQQYQQQPHQLQQLHQQQYNQQQQFQQQQQPTTQAANQGNNRPPPPNSKPPPPPPLM